MRVKVTGSVVLPVLVSADLTVLSSRLIGMDGATDHASLLVTLDPGIEILE